MGRTAGFFYQLLNVSHCEFYVARLNEKHVFVIVHVCIMTSYKQHCRPKVLKAFKENFQIYVFLLVELIIAVFICQFVDEHQHGAAPACSYVDALVLRRLRHTDWTQDSYMAMLHSELPL